MAFLRRLFRGTAPDADVGESGDAGSDTGGAGGDARSDPAELDAMEREHELDVLRGEQERLDELQQRQLRYEKYAWQPPAQGGDRRAEDGDQSAST
jgi:hypothetical protein